MWKQLRTPFAFVRRIHCVGCGTHSIPKNRRVPDFPPPAPVEAVSEKMDKKLHHELLPQMSESQLEALNWSDNNTNSGDLISKHEQNLQTFRSKMEKTTKSQICSGCLLARNGTATDIKVPEETQLVDEDGIEPPKINFQVVDAVDFPLGLPDLQLAADLPKQFAKKYADTVFVINRCDLLVGHQSQLQLLKRYFMEAFFNKRGIKESKVVLISATRGWNLKKLSESFARSAKVLNVFNGPANSGKTKLVHVLSGVDKNDLAGGASTWPLPFTTQEPQVYTSQGHMRSKKMVDMPSVSMGGGGAGCFGLLRPNLVRKVSAGTKMTNKTPKYTVPKVLGKSGQTVSVGGLVALEFPHIDVSQSRRLPYHVFGNIGGLAHTEFLHTFKDLEQVNKMNHSDHPNHIKMRMHDVPNLELVKKLSFQPLLPTGERQSLVIQGMGFVQPYYFGSFPPYYTVTVWAPKDIEVGVRKEVLPKVFKSLRKSEKTAKKH